jgi:hypothetical protein
MKLGYPDGWEVNKNSEISMKTLLWKQVLFVFLKFLWNKFIHDKQSVNIFYYF